MGSSEFRLTDGLLNPCELWFAHLQSGTNDSNPTGLSPREDVDECSLAHCVSLSPTSSFGLQTPLYLQC